MNYCEIGKIAVVLAGVLLATGVFMFVVRTFMGWSDLDNLDNRYYGLRADLARLENDLKSKVGKK